MPNDCIKNALKQLPQVLSEQLTPSNSLTYLEAKVVDAWCRHLALTLPELGERLLSLAASFAVTPISNFNVGAVAFDSEGNAYLGANFEFANVHIGQTIHAEQSAIAHAWQRGALDLALLVINYPPCGHCRQFINEVNLANDFRILLPTSKPKPLSYYLPQSFGPNDLNISDRILGKSTLPSGNGDLLSVATAACKASHAPYSNSPSGIALEYNDGDIISGRYAENAAFNPSLPPLQMALNYRRLQGKDWQAIKQVIMVEEPSTLSQKDNTIELLQSFNHTQLQYYQ